MEKVFEDRADIASAELSSARGTSKLVIGEQIRESTRSAVKKKKKRKKIERRSRLHLQSCSSPKVPLIGLNRSQHVTRAPTSLSLSLSYLPGAGTCPRPLDIPARCLSTARSTSANRLSVPTFGQTKQIPPSFEVEPSAIYVIRCRLPARFSSLADRSILSSVWPTC